MKNSTWFACSLLFLAAVLWLGRPATARAADGHDMPMDRLERLERRVNEMAERQEQFLRRFGAQLEQQQRAPGQPGLDNPRLQMAPPFAPGPVMGHPHAAQLAKGLHDFLGLLCLIGLIFNILLAIWIFTDIRKRGEGSGIFIALALVAGIPAAIIYTLTRIGDKKT
jgi:hypothetical protein